MSAIKKHIIDLSENSVGKFKSGSVRHPKKAIVRCPGSSLVKMHCKVADKNSPQSSHHMSSHDSSQSGGGFFSDFQRSFECYRFSNVLLQFLLNSDMFS